MTTPGLSGMMPPGEDDIPRRLRALEAQVAALASARSLEAATIGGGGLIVKGGQIEVQDASGAMQALLDDSGIDVDGTLHVSGNTVIDGTLSLPAGIIDNDALANPVSAATFTASSVLSLTFTNAYQSFLTKNIPVPAGFTEAVVMATVVATGIASSSSPATAECRAVIGGNIGPSIAALSSGGVVAVSPHSVHLTGLSGGNIAVVAQARDGTSGGGSLGSGLSGCQLSGFAIFLR